MPQRGIPKKPNPLVLACEFQRLLENGAVNNKAEIAHRYDLSRARVTQIMSLLKLPAAIKKEILDLPEPERHKFCERRLRKFIKAYRSKGNPGPKKSDKTSVP